MPNLEEIKRELREKRERWKQYDRMAVAPNYSGIPSTPEQEYRDARPSGTRRKSRRPVMTKVTIKYKETGVVRPPRRGEYFRGSSGFEERARFDFHVQSFPILKEVVKREKEPADD